MKMQPRDNMYPNSNATLSFGKPISKIYMWSMRTEDDHIKAAKLLSMIQENFIIPF